MPQVQRTINIAVGVETAFALVADQPERMGDWWPLIERQVRLTPAPTGLGSVSRYVYNMCGIRIKGEHQVQDFQRNEHFYIKTTSGIDCSFDFRFVPDGQNMTRLTLSISYQLPGSLLSHLLSRVMIEDENVRNLEHGLDNLKHLLEQESSRVSTGNR